MRTTPPWRRAPEKVKTTPYTGYKYRTYRNVYDANGKLISSTYEATSDYKSRNKVILRGPAVEPADGGAQIPTDTTEPTTPVEPTEPQDPDVPAEPTEPTTPDNGWTIQTPEQDGQQTAEGQTGTGTTGESELSTGRPAPGRTLCMTARGILSLFAERGSRISGCLFVFFRPPHILALSDAGGRTAMEKHAFHVWRYGRRCWCWQRAPPPSGRSAIS